MKLIGCQNAKWISINDFDEIDFLEMNFPVVQVLKRQIESNILSADF